MHNVFYASFTQSDHGHVSNHVEALDPALKRPGRMDVWVEFKNASREQVRHCPANWLSSELTLTLCPPGCLVMALLGRRPVPQLLPHARA
jgi:hypothetical protein